MGHKTPIRTVWCETMNECTCDIYRHCWEDELWDIKLIFGMFYESYFSLLRSSIVFGIKNVWAGNLARLKEAIQHSMSKAEITQDNKLIRKKLLQWIDTQNKGPIHTVFNNLLKA